MNTKSFLKYLNREQLLSEQSPVLLTNENEREPVGRKPLNKYRFRKEINKIGSISARGHKKHNREEYGISNYEFALKLKNPPEYETVTPRRDFFSAEPPLVDEEEMGSVELDDSRSINVTHHVSRDHKGRNEIWSAIKNNK
jgi:hypothetical protein